MHPVKNDPEISLDTLGGQSLKQLFSNWKRYRVPFFNSEDVIRVLLQLHPHLLRQVDESRHFASCVTGFERRWSNFKSTTCAVQLCIGFIPPKKRRVGKNGTIVNDCISFALRPYDILDGSKETKGNADHESTASSNRKPEAFPVPSKS